MITVICPSRGRPGNVARLIDSFDATKKHAHTQLIIAIDSTDPQLDEYSNVLNRRADVLNRREAKDVFLLNIDNKRTRMVETLNRAASYEIGSYEVAMLGFVGDDHLFETEGWDTFLIECFTPMGIAYGDDGHQHANLPTAVFMDADIVRRLGWMAPPELQHLYVDNAWKALGEALGTLRYYPEIRITHLHPHAGLAEWDETYAESNAPEVDSADREKFYEWANGDGLRDAVKELKRRG